MSYMLFFVLRGIMLPATMLVSELHTDRERERETIKRKKKRERERERIK